MRWYDTLFVMLIIFLIAALGAGFGLWVYNHLTVHWM